MPTDPLPVAYDALRKLAQQRLAAERPGHTLQATALVHDVYLKLAGESPERWKDTAHFFNTAAEAMRRVLIDHARARAQIKRRGGRRITFNEAVDVAALNEGADPDDVLALDAAMSRLAEIHPEIGQVVRLRFYAGLNVQHVAHAMAISERTVKRHWTFARAWLYQRLCPEPVNQAKRIPTDS